MMQNEKPRGMTPPNEEKSERSGQTLSRVRSVSRAIAIIRCFNPERPHLPLGEIAKQAELDAGTTRRLLVTLRDEGVVGQSQKTGNYFLAMQVMRWAAAVPDGKSLRDIAETSLNELSNHIRTTVFLSVLHEDSAVCLSRFHGDAPVQVRWWSVGGTLPLNCGAAPRLLLAYLPEDERERIINAPLIALTSQSMTNRDELRAELERIRATGWSHARDDVAEGLSALAAPIRDETGAVVAAVSLGGLSPTVASPEGIDPPPRAYTELLRCCKKITQELALDDFTS